MFPIIFNHIRKSAAEAVFSFDSSLSTFTAKMAKRTGSLFAGAPIVQGDFDGSGTGDVLSFPRGNAISGDNTFRANSDTNQGSIVFVITPEWDGDDSIKHQIYDEDNIQIYKDTGNNLVLSHRGGTGLPEVDISGWTAGTSYHVCASWDTNNTLDGTNYVRISVNDSHTFGDTSLAAAISPGATIRIGSNAGTNPSNAIIEGLTVYRRVLYDGTRGIDVGNGDEIAAMYNSGSFKDPAEVTGAHDIVFCLPTDASPGELATGEGEAWSMPHSSNLITAADGFMTSTAWANWTAEGTPSANGLTDDAQRIYLGGYKFTSDAANEGYYFDVTVTAGDDWVIRAIGHSDGTSVPKCILYDQTNTAEIGSLTGSTSSTRTAPDVFIFTGEAPAGCTTLRVKLVSTAASGVTYWHQVELYENLITNPSLQGGAGDPYIPTGWSNDGLDAGETAQETTTVHSGSDSLKWNNGASSSEGMFNTNGYSKATGTFVAWGFWSYGNGTETVTLTARQNRVDPQVSSASEFTLAGNTAVSWGHSSGVGRHNVASTEFPKLEVATAGANRYTDDIYIFELDPVSLTATAASEANSAEGTGLRVDGLDSLTQPVPQADISNDYIKITFPITPRHDPADVAKFGETDFIFTLHADASNYIALSWNSAVELRVTVIAGGTICINTTDVSATEPAAGEKSQAVFEYTKGGDVVFTVDGDELYRKTTTASDDFDNLSAFTMYWGEQVVGGTARRADAVIG